MKCLAGCARWTERAGASSKGGRAGRPGGAGGGGRGRRGASEEALIRSGHVAVPSARTCVPIARGNSDGKEARVLDRPTDGDVTSDRRRIGGHTLPQASTLDAVRRVHACSQVSVRA